MFGNSWKRPLCSHEEEVDGTTVSCQRKAAVTVDGQPYCKWCVADKYRLHRDAL